MTAGEALLREILARPEDDAPRLVYADWLDEHGEAARAEFIRVQCELARLEEWDERRPYLEQRQEQLLETHGEKWAEGLAETTDWFEFRRGFLEFAALPPEVFLANAGRLFHRFPFRRLRLDGDFGDPSLRKLAASPHLGRLTRLEIVLQFCPVTAAGLWSRNACVPW
jgi:uncharacterized protein (TIGR02996 family)